MKQVKILKKEELKQKYDQKVKLVESRMEKEGSARLKMMEEIDRIIDEAKVKSENEFIANDLRLWFDRAQGYNDWFKNRHYKMLSYELSHFSYNGDTWKTDFESIWSLYNFHMNKIVMKGSSLKYDNPVVSISPLFVYNFFKFLQMTYEEIYVPEWNYEYYSNFRFCGIWYQLNDKISFKVFQNGKMEIKGIF